MTLTKSNWVRSNFLFVTTEKRMFSEESSQAIFDMGTVGFIELKKKSRTQCPSCLHQVFKRTIICSCGKLVKPDQKMIRRIKKAFEILYFWTSMFTSRGFNHGPNSWQEHHSKATDAQRGCSTKGKSINRYGIDGRTTQVCRKSQVAVGWSDAFVRYSDTISAINESHHATQKQRSKFHHLIYLRASDDD